MINYFKNLNKFNKFNNIFKNNFIINNNNYNYHLRFYCNHNNINNKNEEGLSIQDITFKEKEVYRIINLLLNSQYYLNNLGKFKRFEIINFEEKLSNNNNNQLDIKDIKEYNKLKSIIQEFETLNKNFKDYQEIVEMSKIESDQEMLKESKQLLNLLYQICTDMEINVLMIGEDDDKGCFLEVHAGAGGLDSMDWTEILYNMYLKWAERKGFQVQVVESLEGEHGLKRATLKIDGLNAYGWLRTEMGIHKLIRISPFNADSKRHTSFSSVLVYPSQDNSINVDLKPNDLKIEFTRSSGAGGQHVNKTESAVRILHIPTNISVFCSSERSQHQNKAIGMDLLKSKIFRHYLNQRNEKEKKFRDDLGNNGFGGNIVRSYTMHPQERVKDQRTNYESSQLTNILNGEEELDSIIKLTLSING